ncbi:hypothetical protein EDD90_9495 [Streptomyces sp. Ag109_O5-1]|nr:hypothetical protein EDD90_9495 [Streptomyces sp. Ag109_O5-1]
MPSADACAGLCWPGSGFVPSDPCVRLLRRRNNSNAAPASASPPGRAIERYDLVRLRLADPWAAAASWGMTVCPTLGTSWLGEDPGEGGGVRTKLGRRPRTQRAASPWESRSRDAGGRERRRPRRRRLGDDAERVLLVAVAATFDGRAATVALSNAAAHQRREPLANAYGSLRCVQARYRLRNRAGPWAPDVCQRVESGYIRMLPARHSVLPWIRGVGRAFYMRARISAFLVVNSSSVRMPASRNCASCCSCSTAPPAWGLTAEQAGEGCARAQAPCRAPSRSAAI